jgi:hypothetical protein
MMPIKQVLAKPSPAIQMQNPISDKQELRVLLRQAIVAATKAPAIANPGPTKTTTFLKAGSNMLNFTLKCTLDKLQFFAAFRANPEMFLNRLQSCRDRFVRELSFRELGELVFASLTGNFTVGGLGDRIH